MAMDSVMRITPLTHFWMCDQVLSLSEVSDDEVRLVYQDLEWERVDRILDNMEMVLEVFWHGVDYEGDDLRLPLTDANHKTLLKAADRLEVLLDGDEESEGPKTSIRNGWTAMELYQEFADTLGLSLQQMQQEIEFLE